MIYSDMPNGYKEQRDYIKEIGEKNFSEKLVTAIEFQDFFLRLDADNRLWFLENFISKKSFDTILDSIELSSGDSVSARVSFVNKILVNLFHIEKKKKFMVDFLGQSYITAVLMEQSTISNVLRIHKNIYAITARPGDSATYENNSSFDINHFRDWFLLEFISIEFLVSLLSSANHLTWLFDSLSTYLDDKPESISAINLAIACNKKSKVRMFRKLEKSAPTLLNQIVCSSDNGTLVNIFSCIPVACYQAVYNMLTTEKKIYLRDSVAATLLYGSDEAMRCLSVPQCFAIINCMGFEFLLVYKGEKSIFGFLSEFPATIKNEMLSYYSYDIAYYLSNTISRLALQDDEYNAAIDVINIVLISLSRNYQRQLVANIYSKLANCEEMVALTDKLLQNQGHERVELLENIFRLILTTKGMYAQLLEYIAPQITPMRVIELLDETSAKILSLDFSQSDLFESMAKFPEDTQIELFLHYYLHVLNALTTYQPFSVDLSKRESGYQAYIDIFRLFLTFFDEPTQWLGELKGLLYEQCLNVRSIDYQDIQMSFSVVRKIKTKFFQVSGMGSHDAGADTVLHLAAYFKNTDILRHIARLEVDITSKSSIGLSALEIAQTKGLNDDNCIRLLHGGVTLLQRCRDYLLHDDFEAALNLQYSDDTLHIKFSILFLLISYLQQQRTNQLKNKSSFLFTLIPILDSREQQLIALYIQSQPLTDKIRGLTTQAMDIIKRIQANYSAKKAQLQSEVSHDLDLKKEDVVTSTVDWVAASDDIHDGSSRARRNTR